MSSFLVCISETILSLPRTEIISLFYFCDTGMVVGITCWSTSSSPDILNLGDFFYSINAYWSFCFVAWHQNPYNWHLFIFVTILDRDHYWFFPMSYYWCSLKVFAEGQILTTVFAMQILISTKSIISSFHSTYSIAFCVFFSSTDTSWWITLAQYFLFFIFNKFWDRIFFVLSKTSLAFSIYTVGHLCE